MSKKSFSNILIILSFAITLVSFVSSDMVVYGMNTYFLGQGMYVTLVIQFLLYQFLHGGILHLLSNSIGLYLFGNQVERLIGEKNFVVFFVLGTLFVGVALLALSDGNTIGISGFVMAILAYLFMDFRTRGNREYQSVGVFLVINIAIGFTSNVSLVGHLFGAIFGILFFLARPSIGKSLFRFRK